MLRVIRDDSCVPKGCGGVCVCICAVAIERIVDQV